jgi:hypothetical protein
MGRMRRCGLDRRKNQGTPLQTAMRISTHTTLNCDGPGSDSIWSVVQDFRLDRSESAADHPTRIFARAHTEA